MAYWYGSTNGAPAKVNIIDQADSAAVNANTTIDFALSDATGMPVTGGTQPQVTVVSGGGRLRTIFSREPVNPGVWEISVRMGPTAGLNAIHVELGDAKRDITIFAQ